MYDKFTFSEFFKRSLGKGFHHTRLQIYKHEQVKVCSMKNENHDKLLKYCINLSSLNSLVHRYCIVFALSLIFDIQIHVNDN